MKPSTFALCLICSLPAPAAHAGTLRTVALTGQQAPGMPDGTAFNSFDPRPLVLNDAGETAFAGLYSNGSDFGQGIWSEGGGSLNLVAAQGQQAPGLPDGVTYNYFPSPGRLVINDAGTTVFSAFLTGPGAPCCGIWSSGPGGSALVARDGGQVAGTPAGVFYGVYPTASGNNAGNTFLANDAGQVAFQTLISGSDWAILAYRHGNIELVARPGSHAPGTPDGVNFFDLNLGGLALNNSGQTAFTGPLTGGGVNSTNDVGIWSEGSGSLALIARKGNQAPGMPDGAVFNPPFSVGSLDLNNAGQMAFRSSVTGGGVDSTNNYGIWLGTAGDLSLVARKGDHPPGTPSGVKFGTPIALALNDAGQIAFSAGLAGTGIDSTNDFGLWSGAPDSLALVAREGDHAPGTEDGVVFAKLSDPYDTLILNAAGQTAFFAQLAGSGISATNDFGIWATDRSGALQLIAREGDPLEVAPGDFRTVSGLIFFDTANQYVSGNSDGRPSAFNNRGQVAFAARFTDGTSGIFVSNAVAIPEPNTLLLGAIAFAGLFLPRRRSKDGPRAAPYSVPEAKSRTLRILSKSNSPKSRSPVRKASARWLMAVARWIASGVLSLLVARSSAAVCAVAGVTGTVKI
jgi:hypothetical protein